MKSLRRTKNNNMTPFMSSTPVEGTNVFDYETYDDRLATKIT